MIGGRDYITPKRRLHKVVPRPSRESTLQLLSPCRPPPWLKTVGGAPPAPLHLHPRCLSLSWMRLLIARWFPIHKEGCSPSAILHVENLQTVQLCFENLSRITFYPLEALGFSQCHAWNALCGVWTGHLSCRSCHNLLLEPSTPFWGFNFRSRFDPLTGTVHLRRRYPLKLSNPAAAIQRSPSYSFTNNHPLTVTFSKSGESSLLLMKTIIRLSGYVKLPVFFKCAWWISMGFKKKI